MDFSDISLVAGSGALDRIWRLKVRGGYKIGNGLLYASGGFANAKISLTGNDDGYFIGGGYEHQLKSNFTLGGEILYHEFDNFLGTPVKIEVISYQVRAAYRF